MRRAMVIDDNNNGRIAATRALKKVGYKVDSFQNGAMFFEKWKPGLVDLVVSDWRLSGSERGDELFSELRARDWEVPLILVSGQLTDTERRLEVFAKLLDASNTRFVLRGEGAFGKISALAEEMEERRDKVLQRLIKMHRGAYENPLVFSQKPDLSLLERLLRDAAFASKHEARLLDDLYTDIKKEE